MLGRKCNIILFKTLLNDVSNAIVVTAQGVTGVSVALYHHIYTEIGMEPNLEAHKYINPIAVK